MYKGINKYKENGKINIVIHHSAGNQSGNFNKTLESYNRIHKDKYFDTYENRNGMGQEIGIDENGNKTPYGYIAYHYCIGGKGEYIRNKLTSQVGYHCGNWNYNNKSIAICLLGNFQYDKITEKQLETLKWMLFEIVKNYGDKDTNGKLLTELNIKGHKDLMATACPGNNIYDNFIINKELENYIKNKIEEYNKKINEEIKQKEEENKIYSENEIEDMKKNAMISILKLKKKYGKNYKYKLYESIYIGQKLLFLKK